MIADPFITEALIHCRQCKFNRNTHVVADTGWRCASTAAETVNGNNISTAAGNSTGDGSNVVNRCHFYNNGLLVICRLFQRTDQLPQILYGINIVVRCRRDGVRSFGYHSGTGHISDDLGSGQMSSDTRLCALPHLDLYSSSGFKILFMHTETSGGNLNDGVFTIHVEIFMQTTFTSVIANAKLLRCFGKTGMGVIADRAIAHGREHDWHGKLDLRRQLTF